MKKIFILTVTIFALALAGSAHAMDGHDMSTDKIGTLFHESMKEGFMLSYYLMDMRDQKDSETAHTAHGKKEMDKPHHIMVYIMDKNHKPVVKGKVGFLIKDEAGNAQKHMAMYMSQGFGITADMKKKGRYTITTKALVGDVKLMDSFTHEIR